MSYKTEQEEFWANDFGNEYVDRNQDDGMRRVPFYSELLSHIVELNSVIELGPNIGANLDALTRLKPNLHCRGVEINKKAFDIVSKKYPDCVNSSIFDYTPDKKFDLSMTCGVMIHINPDELHQVYEKLYKSTNRYILVAEYYNPVPVEIEYRGHKGRLFKRDFAGEMLDKYPLELRAYGFSYHRDNHFPADDGNWFLMEKKH